jgi:hypothetical protein
MARTVAASNGVEALAAGAEPSALAFVASAGAARAPWLKAASKGSDPPACSNWRRSTHDLRVEETETHLVPQPTRNVAASHTIG